MFFIITIILCICVGCLANSRGRSGFGWTVLALVISPILSGILVLCLKDLYYTQK